MDYKSNLENVKLQTKKNLEGEIEKERTKKTPSK